jgi:hypothetical protein
MSRRTNTSSFGPRLRGALALGLTLVGLLAFVVAHAFADAGNPILATIQGTVVPDNPANPNGGVTVYVRGQWNWLTHNTDCNFDRAAAGVGIVWNDPNGADRTRTISTATRSGTTVAINVPTQTFDVGDHITVAGVTGGTGFNGDFVITARSNTQIKYTSAGTGSGSGGTVTDNDVYNGFKVQQSPITAYVGTQTATPGDPVDNMVHPVDRGNQVEGYTSGTWKSTAQGYTTNAAGDYPSGQAFVDPASNSPNDFATWKGGCGREPTTATASQGTNPERTGNSCGTTPASTVCSGYPWGSWGYEKNGGLGYSHNYAKRSDLTTVCANFYDVHGGGKFNSGKFQLVNGAKEITVTANGDNSIQTNAFNTAQGANCFSFSQGTPTIATTATGGTIGDSISDSATISGLVSPTGSGSITFTAYAPQADGTADTSCTTAVYTKTVTGVGADGTYGSGSFTPSGVAPQIAGTYEWIASFSGDAKNTAVTGACGDAGEQSVLNRHSSTVPTAQKILISDYARVTSSNGTTPTGSVTFQLFTNSTCTSAGKIFDSGPVQLVNGLAHADDSNPLSVNGTYYWLASYSGDATFQPAVSPCGAEQTTVSGNTPGIAP